jgi:hypothetical protein
VVYINVDVMRAGELRKKKKKQNKREDKLK